LENVKEVVAEFKERVNAEIRRQEKLNIVLWDALDMNNFYFLFLLFSDFIGILFSFSFSFLLDNEKARNIEVT